MSWLRKHSFRGALWTLSLFKLWLVAGQYRPAFTHAAHDDELFVKLAVALSKGDWLGTFDRLTLIKGPVYPLFLALCYTFSLPAYLMQQLLYVAACLLLVKVTSEWIPQEKLQVLIYGVFLFNPVSFSFPMTHFKRESIYGSLSLLVVAGLIALYCRTSEEDTAALTKWGIFLGALAAAFWLTREEGIWIIPPTAVFLAFAAYRWVKRPPEERYRLAWRYLLPFSVWCAGLFVVAWINDAHYGLFTINEIKSRSFRAAYGALTRVEHENWLRYVPVPREVRLRIYEVSPSFAELRPHLEGELGRRWAGPGSDLLPEGRKYEIVGGWFLWLFREAVQKQGYYEDGATAKRYYARVAEEINRACDDGKLRAGRRRATLAPRLRREHAGPYLRALPGAVSFVVRLEGSEPRATSNSQGREPKISLFRELSGDRVPPAQGSPPLLHDELGQNRFKLDVLRAVTHLYQRSGGVFAALALAAYLGVAVFTRRNLLRPQFVVTTALLAGLSSHVLLICLIHVSSFPTINLKYLVPSMVLFPPFVMFALVDFGTVAVRRYRKKSEGS